MTAPYASPRPRLLASRVMKARHERACARCGLYVRRGERIGYVDQLGWCHVVPCIVDRTQDVPAAQGGGVAQEGSP